MHAAAPAFVSTHGGTNVANGIHSDAFESVHTQIVSLIMSLVI